uniref:Uncharacterized protein n=1 Tax=Cyanothece sp. (strain PCC 7425 / ATCC 29141) TaxID=395961 RepID=B8HQ20_CYAP4
MAGRFKFIPGLLILLAGISSALVFLQLLLHRPMEEPPLDTVPVVESEPLPTPSLAVKPAPVSSIPGGLRVGNRTTYPIRLVLLSHDQQQAVTAKGYEEPVHWDFAPMEGSTEGLIMSLPEGNLQLQPGDVLVGFALDGSKRYWGPFVVGQTQLPQRQGQTQEWQLDFRE